MLLNLDTSSLTVGISRSRCIVFLLTYQDLLKILKFLHFAITRCSHTWIFWRCALFEEPRECSSCTRPALFIVGFGFHRRRCTVTPYLSHTGTYFCLLYFPLLDHNGDRVQALRIDKCNYPTRHGTTWINLLVIWGTNTWEMLEMNELDCWYF